MEIILIIILVVLIFISHQLSKMGKNIEDMNDRYLEEHNARQREMLDQMMDRTIDK